MDSALQVFIYGCMGAMSNDASKLAFIVRERIVLSEPVSLLSEVFVLQVGFYKAWQSAGSAITWGIDSAKSECVSIVCMFIYVGTET
jgi:hypothetical protein